MALLLLICSVSALIKLSALLIPATLIITALLEQRWRLAAIFAAGAVGSLVLFAGYLAYFDLDLDLSILKAHSERPQSPLFFWTLFTELKVVTLSFRDASVVLGLLGLCWYLSLSYSGSLERFMLAGLFAGAALICWVAPIEHYPWYKFSLFPLIVVGLGYFRLLCFRGERLALIFLVPLSVLQLADPAGRYCCDYSRLYLAGILLIGALLFLDPSGKFRRIGSSAALIGIWAVQTFKLFGSI